MNYQSRFLFTSVLTLVFLLASCSDDSSNDPTDPGITPEVGISSSDASKAVSLFTNLSGFPQYQLQSWESRQGCPSVANWDFNPDNATWNNDGGYHSDVTVGDPQGSYTRRVSLSYSSEVSFFNSGTPVQHWGDADSCRISGFTRNQRYIVQPEFTLEDPYDFTSTYSVSGPIDEGTLHLISGTANMAGHQIDPAFDASADTLNFLGTASVSFEVIDGDWGCHGYRMDLILQILNTRDEILDTYSGVDSVSVGGSDVGGAIRSELGNGGIIHDGGRSCSH